MFKVGDKVGRVKGSHRGMLQGDVGTVKNVLGGVTVELVEYGHGHDIKNLAPVLETTALDVQVGGGHYKKLAIQPVEYIMGNNIPYMEGNVIKYVTRWRDKAGVQDLEKAVHYLQMLIEKEKSKGV